MAAAQPIDSVREMRGLRRSFGNFVDGKFLSVEEVDHCLKNQPKSVNEAGKGMICYIKKTIPDDFLQLGITFPVTNLQHVTTEFSMRQIVQSGYFIAEVSTILPSNLPKSKLSCWSVQIPREQIEEAQQEAFLVVQGMVPENNAREFEEKFNAQFANSPAFSDDSRYGNFKFSLSLSDLLSEYKELHCSDSEPEFRVLGTAMYKQEIAHIVLVHSPTTTQFNDLPFVPDVERNAKPLPFVFRSQEDGKFYWRPESTADILKMRIFENQCRMRECPLSTPCYDNANCLHCLQTYTVWNHLIFAFHLPENEPLRIPREKLKESLTACDIKAPYMGKGRAYTQQEAGEMISNLEIQYELP
ncbi:hypothetical protein XELAEV_18013933mg [Xenopus laevis]|uniref:Uncharacterized protein n=1 Tax=Xenopus laevis TaxID=8355 RepID=A0A974HZU7_XENLA|nr:hypothetical protein XELAEV_18013933mg [Xenopus laevis]